MANPINKASYLTVKDHSVSGEIFHLILNEEFQMLETYPQPAHEDLPKYYQSDDYISHTDSKRNLFEKLYQIVKSISLKRKLKLINAFSEESKQLLDVGCGTGDFLKIAQTNGWSIAGIEPNLHARTIANQKTRNSVFDVSQISKFESKSFDVITLWHVLEHLPDLNVQISTFHKLLKSSGSLIIAVPNHKSYDALHYKNYWAGFDVPRHLWHFSQTSISKLVSKFGMRIVEVLPMKFDSYYVSLLSEKYKNGKMNVFKSLFIGWKANMKARSTGEYSSLIYVIKKEQTPN